MKDPVQPRFRITPSGIVIVVLMVIIIGLVEKLQPSNPDSDTAAPAATVEASTPTPKVETIIRATQKPTAEPTQAPTPKPTPTPTPEPTSPPPTRAQLKAQFLQTVDESISGARIEGNPNKFIGDNVDLHGSVVNVLDDSSFNFTTGDIESGDYAIILVTTDPGEATDLEAGQSLRVIGTVVEPTEGTNAMGGSMDFPTVHAEYME